MTKQEIKDFVASSIYACTYGGTSDPTLSDMVLAQARYQANIIVDELDAEGLLTIIDD